MKHQGDMAAPKGDVTKAPDTKGAPHKDPSYGKISSEMVRTAPQHSKKALPLADAPPGVAGVNGGQPVPLPAPHTLKK